MIDGDLIYEIDDADDLQRVQRGHGEASSGSKSLGTVQKAPLVLADGKIYVGTEAGKFFILRPHPGQGGSPQRGGVAVGTVDNAGQSQGIPEPIFGWRGDFARAGVLRLDGGGLCARTEEGQSRDGLGRR